MRRESVFTEKIKIGLYGFGNVARGVLSAVKSTGDLTVSAVFSRRDVFEMENPPKGIPVFKKNELLSFKGKLDVLIMCGGSRGDLPKETPYAARYFNVVDSFDTHKVIKEHFKNTDKAARAGKNTAIVSVGWDPGIFSVFRAYFKSFLPKGADYTFWGDGVSEGHSEALREIDGVLDARQYTVPKKEALEIAESGALESLSPRQMHERVCYVTVKDGANKEKIEKSIVNMENYFDEYDTKVYYIEEEQMRREHSGLSHGGVVIRNGRTGEGGCHIQKARLELRLCSNPEFTGSVLAAFARAAVRLNKAGEFGCKTALDIAPALLLEDGIAENGDII